MADTRNDLFRSVRIEAFPNGAVIEDKPAPEILYPDFQPRLLPSGKRRAADVALSTDKLWVHAGGGTSLFDRPNIFKSKSWLTFSIPAGTEVPDSLAIRHTGHNHGLNADHYQIESRAKRMRLDAYKGALDNLARNAIVMTVETSRRSSGKI